MTTFVIIAMICAMIGVAVSLAYGLVTMLKGEGIANSRKSNTLMQWRLYLQGIALALFAIVLVLVKQ